MTPDLCPGSHIKVGRGLYEHHGIYMGLCLGSHVVAELAKPQDGGTVRFVPWRTFCRDDQFQVVEHADGLPLRQVVANVQRASNRGMYDLFNWNCEHFATWCATMKPRSHQVEVVSAGALLLLGVVILGKLAA